MNDKIFEIPSTTLREECYTIRDLALKLPDNSVIVEIGTGAGRVTAVLAETVAGRGSIIYTIDNYSQAEKYEEYGEWKLHSAKKSLKYLNVNGHCRFIEGDSVKVASDLNKYNLEINNGIDMIYLDGSHKYKDLCEEIDAWYPHIKAGGIISGHDFDFNCNDGRNVIKAVFDKLMKNPDKFMQVRGRVWMIER